MISLPKIQIQIQDAKVGIQVNNATQNIRQPKATFQMTTTNPKVEIQSPQGELRVDQRKAWDALGVGNNLVNMKRYYSKALSTGIENIGKIVDKGNQMAAIHLGGNPIASIAKQRAFQTMNMIQNPPTSVDNVDVSFVEGVSNYDVNQGEVDIQLRMNKAEFEYRRGKVQYQMLQEGGVKIIPPQIDTHM